MRHAEVTTALLFGSLLLVGAWGEVALSQTSAPPPVGRPAVAPAERRPMEIEGTVKKIDPAAQTVKVGTGPFGFFGSTLQVTADTRIELDGRQATLAEIKEGGKVKAAYEYRDGKRVVTSISAMPAAQ